MNLWNAWRSMLGLASLCLAIIGCGGGDIPDPDADSNAAAEPPAASGPAAPAAPGPAAPAPAVAATEAPAAPAPAEASAPAAAPTAEPVAAASAPAEMPAATATATAEAETPATAADPGRAKNASATAEMLALGNKPLPVETPAAATAPNGSPAPGAPGAMANNMMPGPIPPTRRSRGGHERHARQPAMPPGGMISPAARQRTRGPVVARFRDTLGEPAGPIPRLRMSPPISDRQPVPWKPFSTRSKRRMRNGSLRPRPDAHRPKLWGRRIRSSSHRSWSKALPRMT